MVKKINNNFIISKCSLYSDFPSMSYDCPLYLGFNASFFVRFQKAELMTEFDGVGEMVSHGLPFLLLLPCLVHGLILLSGVCVDGRS